MILKHSGSTALLLFFLTSLPHALPAKSGEGAASGPAGWGQYWENESSPSEAEFKRLDAKFSQAMKARNFAAAHALADEMMRKFPESASPQIYRGYARVMLKRLDSANSDLAAGIARARASKSNSVAAFGLTLQAQVASQQGKFDEARTALRLAVRLDPEEASVHNNYAWFLATCRNDASRNGKEAVQVATKACELTKWNSASALDTLAAACAEAGDFKTAIAWQQKANGLSRAKKEPPMSGDKRLALYQNNQRYRSNE